MCVGALVRPHALAQLRARPGGSVDLGLRWVTILPSPTNQQAPVLPCVLPQPVFHFCVVCELELCAPSCAQVVVANPKTAGVARWIFLALWGSHGQRKKKGVLVCAGRCMHDGISWLSGAAKGRGRSKACWSVAVCGGVMELLGPLGQEDPKA
eukprot:1157327-Pelagomonas_calceolata.AAC.4